MGPGTSERTAPAARAPAARPAHSAPVCFVSLYYWPDEGAVPRMLTELAEDCAAAGLAVTVLTSRGRYRSIQQRPLPAVEERQGVRIRRIWATGFGRATVWGRLCDYASFLLSAAGWLFFVARPRLVVCVSSPPMLATVIVAVARLRRWRLVYKVEDVHPDLALALGILRPGWISRLASCASRFALDRASRVVAIDAAMAGRLRATAPRARVDVIPNWADAEAVSPDETAGREFRRRLGLEGKFVVLYSGNLGLAHSFRDVMAAARRLEAEGSSAFFLFIGEGPRLAEARSAAGGLACVSFLDYLPRHALGASHAAADLFLVTLQPEAEGLVVPSKAYTGMAAARPILYVAPGGDDMARTIRGEEIGWVVPPDPCAIADAIRQAEGDPVETARRGRRAREVLLRRHERRLLTVRWSDMLRRELQAAGNGAAGAGGP